VLQDVSQQIEVLNHRGGNLTTKYTKYTKRNLAGIKDCGLKKMLGKRPAILAGCNYPTREKLDWGVGRFHLD
jgi:hypothetical protein